MTWAILLKCVAAQLEDEKKAIVDEMAAVGVAYAVEEVAYAVEVADDKGGKNIDATGYRISGNPAYAWPAADSKDGGAVHVDPRGAAWRTSPSISRTCSACRPPRTGTRRMLPHSAASSSSSRGAAASCASSSTPRATTGASRRHTTGCSCCTARPRTDPDDDRRANRDAFTGRVLAVTYMSVAYGEEKLAGKLRRAAAPRLFTFLPYPRLHPTNNLRAAAAQGRYSTGSDGVSCKDGMRVPGTC